MNPPTAQIREVQQRGTSGRRSSGVRAHIISCPSAQARPGGNIMISSLTLQTDRRHFMLTAQVG